MGTSAALGVLTTNNKSKTIGLTTVGIRKLEESKRKIIYDAPKAGGGTVKAKIDSTLRLLLQRLVDVKLLVTKTRSERGIILASGYLPYDQQEKPSPECVG